MALSVVIEMACTALITGGVVSPSLGGTSREPGTMLRGLYALRTISAASAKAVVSIRPNVKLAGVWLRSFSTPFRPKPNTVMSPLPSLIG
ncbi:MAG: hypothetical protein ACU841_16200, partial [Gammaproteobacteria bacterium]